MHHRTCIPNTHSIALFMHHAKQVVVLSNGKVVAQGSPEEIALSEILRDQRVGFDSNANSRPSSSIGHHPTTETPSPVYKVEESTQSAAWEDNETEHVHSVEAIEPVPIVTEPLRLESKAIGAMKWDLFTLYFTAFGRWYFWVAMSLMFFANQLSSLSIDLWIREWSNSYHDDEMTTA